MFLEIPRRSWKRSNRVTPKNASLMMSIVHHSPTTSRVWATEQLIALEACPAHGPTLPDLVAL